jgi:hypothetical protein
MFYASDVSSSAPVRPYPRLSGSSGRRSSTFLSGSEVRFSSLSKYSNCYFGLLRFIYTNSLYLPIRL